MVEPAKEPPSAGLAERIFGVVVVVVLCVVAVVGVIIGVLLEIRGPLGPRIFGGFVLVTAVVLFVLCFVWGRRALGNLIEYLEKFETA